MRRLFGSMMVLVALAVLVGGCGSTGDPTTGDDALIFRFLRFDNTGITQPDVVGENTALVDVVQDICVQGSDTGAMTSTEAYSATVINAVFINQEILDIQLDRYELRVEEADSGLGDSLSYPLAGTVIGGRCSNVPDRSCGVDANCLVAGVQGTCSFQPTKINHLVLFDFDSKTRVRAQLAAVGGRALPVTITFFGTDFGGNSFRTVARYTVTFDHFCACQQGESCTL